MTDQASNQEFYGDNEPSKLTKSERDELAGLMNVLYWSSAQKKRVLELKKKAGC